jgi:hypothetical protein
LENLGDVVDINTIRENITFSAEESLGYKKLRKHKQWFDEGCPELSDERKQAKLQWLQDLSQINGDNWNSVKLEASRYFDNKTRECQKQKLMSLQHSKNKNIIDLWRGINEFKRVTNL